MGPCLFPLDSFASPNIKPVGLCEMNILLKICLLKTLNSMVTLTFAFGVNRSATGTSSTANHRFYRSWDDFVVYTAP